MLILLRRLLVVLALMFWQGGFTFYASVVVPLGQQELGHEMQALVTRQVTVWLNWSGAIALLLLAWDTCAVRDSSSSRRFVRGLCWLVMAGTLAYLFWSHAHLGELLDSEKSQRAVFRAEHRVYLWVSTIQWAAGLLFLVLTLRVWTRETC